MLFRAKKIIFDAVGSDVTFFHQVFVKWTLHVFGRASSQLLPGIKILKIDSVEIFLDLIEGIKKSRSKKIEKIEKSKKLDFN